MIQRSTFHEVEQALARQAAVGLIGPRQVGKTTLAHAIAATRPSLYLDLESPSDRAKLQDAALFFQLHQDRLIILDEIHRVPELFQILRGVIDEGRRAGLRTGRFLVLGSASVELLRQSGESLAGRIAYVEMGPLNITEIPNDAESSNRLWLRGWFPDSFLAGDDQESLALRQGFIRTYLERDVPQFGPRIPAETLERLWTMLAHNQGTLLNASSLAAGLSISAPTVASYVSLLVDLLLVRRLPPFLANVGKRLVRSPRIYIRDSGLLHGLLRLETMDELAGHPVVGKSWEGFAIESLLAAAPLRSMASFYATAAGAEMDLVLEMGGTHGTWAIEVKRGLTGKPERGFYRSVEDIKPSKVFVVHGGRDRFPLAQGIEAISLLELASMLKQL